MFYDYKIYKEIIQFIEDHGVKVPKLAGGTNLLKAIVITALWTEREYDEEEKQELERIRGVN